MPLNTKWIVGAATVALGLSACAGTPPASTSAGATTAAVGPAAAAAQPAGPKAGKNPFPGYTARKTSNGQTLYCREDGVAGTRIPKLVCATEDTLRNQSAEAKKQVHDIRETAGAGGCNPSDPMGC
jgi:hypothetical protein